MSSFGSSLRQKREEQGVLLEDISAATRVSVRYLTALESDDFKALPGGVFNRGIVRGYAHCIHIDEEEALTRFTAACHAAGIDDGGEQEWGEFARNISKQRQSNQRRARWIGVACLVVVVLGVAALVGVMLIRRGVVSLPHFHKNDTSAAK